MWVRCGYLWVGFCICYPMYFWWLPLSLGSARTPCGTVWVLHHICLYVLLCVLLCGRLGHCVCQSSQSSFTRLAWFVIWVLVWVVRSMPWNNNQYWPSGYDSDLYTDTGWRNVGNHSSPQWAKPMRHHELQEAAKNTHNQYSYDNTSFFCSSEWGKNQKKTWKPILEKRLHLDLVGGYGWGRAQKAQKVVWKPELPWSQEQTEELD